MWSVSDDVTWICLILGASFCLLPGTTAASPPVPDTKGTEFIFPTPFCSESSLAHVHVVSHVTEAVNITVIGPDSSYFTVPPGGAVKTDLPCRDFRWDNVSDSAIGIESSGEVSLYLENSGDSFLVYPVDILGRNYTITTVTSSELAVSYFTVSGLNDTLINIVLPPDLTSSVTYNGNTFSADASFQVQLQDRYETLAVKCSCDLSGTTILTSLPVAVVTGAYDVNSGRHVIEQLLPTTMWGRKFLFPSHQWFSETMILKLSGESLNTNIRLYLKEKTMDLEFGTVPKLAMQLSVTDFVAVQANSSVTCLLLFDVIDVNNVSHPTLMTLTPQALYHPVFYFKPETGSSGMFSVNLVLSSQAYDHVIFNATVDSAPFERPMTFMWNLFLLQDLELKSPFSVETKSSNNLPINGVVVQRDSASAHVYSLGMRTTNIYSACSKTPRAHGGNGDGIDNDCDARIDEEYLNQADDDGDNSADEDTMYSGEIQTNSRRNIWAYYREKDEGILSPSVISVIISIVVALAAVGGFIGIMLLAEKIREKINPSRVQPIND